MSPRPRGEVVITALGTAGAYGCGSAALQGCLAAGRVPAAVEIDRGSGFHRERGPRHALLTPAASLAEWVPPAEARRMSPPSRLAVASMRMALAGAGLRPAELAGPGTAVMIATAFGPSSFSEALLRQILLDGPEAASPYLFTESVANAPAAQIAIACGARAASVTLCQREAGALLAVAAGAAAVAMGTAERALVGTVDEMPPLLHALLARFGTLARDPGEACVPAARPFDLHRNGVMPADGATVLLLESAAAARTAGRQPLARLLAWGSAFDPSAPPTGWGHGHAPLGRALTRLLARAGAAGDATGDDGGGLGWIDRVVSGASGSRGGDRLEAAVLRTAWGDAALPPVLTPKAVIGEFGGGFLAAAVLAASGAPSGPTPGFSQVDPALGIAPHDGRPLPAPRRILVSSLAAGGAGAWLVLGRP